MPVATAWNNTLYFSLQWVQLVTWWSLAIPSLILRRHTVCSGTWIGKFFVLSVHLVHCDIQPHYTWNLPRVKTYECFALSWVVNKKCIPHCVTCVSMIAKPHFRKNHISVPCHGSHQNNFLEIYEIFKIVCVSYATARVIQNDVFVCRHLTALCAYGCGPVQCHDRTRHLYTVGFIMHSCDDFLKMLKHGNICGQRPFSAL